MHHPRLPTDSVSSTSPATTDATFEPLPSSWLGQLELSFEAQDGRTRLMRRRHLGPLAVQRPFYPEADGTCHVYLLHPPGGIAGGDRLETTVHLGSHARTLLTTPSATKFYRSVHGRGEQVTSIDVDAGATCEYLPQETIVFDGAKAVIDTHVSLTEGSTYVGWELVSLGRPAADEQFLNGSISQTTKILRGGKPVWFERLHVARGSALPHASYALARQPIVGTMVHVGEIAERSAARVRDAVGERGAGVFSASQLEKVVVCRYLGPRLSQAKMLFGLAWDVLRTACQGKRANVPRIWAT